MNESLTEIAKADAQIISEKINIQLNTLESLANTPWIKGNQLTTKEKLAFLQNEVERSGHKTMMLADINGIAQHTNGEVVDIQTAITFKRHYQVKMQFPTQ